MARPDGHTVAVEQLVGPCGRLLGARRGLDHLVEEVGDQGPPAGGVLRESRRNRRATRRLGPAGPPVRPNGGKRVVGDLTGPDQIPEGVEHRVDVSTSGGQVDGFEEAGPPSLEVTAYRLVQLVVWWVSNRWYPEERELVAEVQRQPPIPSTEGPSTGPHELAFHHQLIQQRIGVCMAAREHVVQEDRGRQVGALESPHNFEQRASSGRGVVGHALPHGEEATEGVAGDWFDLRSQRGE